MAKRKIVTVFLSLLLVLVFPIHAYADDAKARVPVTLTVINSNKKISVTVPASLPVTLYNKKVYTSDCARIINNDSTSSVMVSEITVNNGKYKIVSYDGFEKSAKEDSLALIINGIKTEKEGKLDINDTAFPVIGPQNELHLNYSAKLKDTKYETEDENIAEVIFTIRPC